MLRVDVQKSLTSPSGVFTIDVRLEVEQNGIATLFGNSGAGKTTLLRMIAGLTIPDRGSIAVEGETWFDSSRNIFRPPQARNVGFVFQDYALFPNMTIRENLEYAAIGSDGPWLNRLLELTGLAPMQAHMPNELSGGQKQRVALARALVRRPKVLLLDEPFAALDTEMRVKLQDEIMTAMRELPMSTVMVSHDLSEVFKMSRRVYILENGASVRHGTPMEVFGQQKLSGQFRFTGEVVAIEPQDIVFIVSVIVGNNIVKVMATADEVNDLRVGNWLVLISKAFNPLLIKVQPPNKGIPFRRDH